jgi:hypothetical protein
MALCAVVGLDGIVSASSTSIGSCSDYVLLTAQDYQNFTPMYTPADAAAIALAVVGVWAIAWGFKALGFAAK